MIYHDFLWRVINNLGNVSAEQKDSSQKSDAHFWIHIYIFQYLEGKKEQKLAIFLTPYCWIYWSQPIRDL